MWFCERQPHLCNNMLLPQLPGDLDQRQAEAGS
jgi:hypothetical protein